MHIRLNSVDPYRTWLQAVRAVSSAHALAADDPNLRTLHDHFFSMFQTGQNGAKSINWLGRRYGTHSTQQQAGAVRQDWVAVADAGAMGGLDPEGVRALAFDNVVHAYLEYLRALGKVARADIGGKLVYMDVSLPVQEALNQMELYASSGPPESATIGIDMVPELHEEFLAAIRGLASNTLRFRDPLQGARKLLFGAGTPALTFARELLRQQARVAADRKQASREARWDQDRIRKEQAQARRAAPGKRALRDTRTLELLGSLDLSAASSAQDGSEGSTFDLDEIFKNNPSHKRTRRLHGRY